MWLTRVLPSSLFSHGSTLRSSEIFGALFRAHKNTKFVEFLQCLLSGRTTGNIEDEATCVLRLNGLWWSSETAAAGDLVDAVQGIARASEAAAVWLTRAKAVKWSSTTTTARQWNLSISGIFLRRLQPAVFGVVRSGEKINHSWLFRTFELRFLGNPFKCSTHKVAPTDFPMARWHTDAL